MHISSESCKGCGACCSTDNQAQGDALGCIWSEKELVRFPPEVRRTVIINDDGRVMYFPMERRGDVFTCIHLVGTIGVDAGCGIQDVKPTECALFLPGSGHCLSARRFNGLPESGDPPPWMNHWPTHHHLLEVRDLLGETPRAFLSTESNVHGPHLGTHYEMGRATRNCKLRLFEDNMSLKQSTLDVDESLYNIEEEESS